MNRTKITLATILCALFALPAIATETIFVEVGEVGQPALGFSWTPQGGTVDLRFADNKSLQDGPGLLSFTLTSDSPRGYTGFLQDAAGRKIRGTDFEGTSNLIPTSLRLDAETVWSGMRFQVDGGGTMPPSSLTWNTAPTVGLPTGNQAPLADAGGPYSGAADVDIQFDGSGSSDPDGDIVSYEWDFGDNQTGTGARPVHRYDVADTYTVRLTVTDDAGTKDSASAGATIGADDSPPRADPGGGPNRAYTGTVGVPIQFDGSGSSDDVGIDAYDWEWGDGSPSSSGVMPQHTYTKAGFFTVEMRVRDTSGQISTAWATADVAGGNQPPVADAGPPVTGKVGEPVSFDATGSSDPEGEITEYAWDFGDDSDVVTDAGATPSHTYTEPGTYTVTLIVTDPDDPDLTDSDFTTADITGGNQLPSADAGGPYTGGVGEPVEFNATDSTDPDGSIVQYVWDFGDENGSTALGATVSHTYDRGGSYRVLLTVIDDDGGIASDPTTVLIGGTNEPPVADTGGPYAGLDGEAVRFNGTDSSDPDGSIVRYDWEYGDGKSDPDAGSTPTHTYIGTGSYEVTLTVTDDAGGQDVEKTTVTISEGNQPPVADPGGPYRGQVGVPISFDGNASSDPDGSISTYSWNLGDDGTRKGKKPTYTYAAPGFYHVTLTVTDDDGLPGSAGTLAIIGDGGVPPIADAGGPYAGSVNKAVSFDGSGSTDLDGEIATYVWDFGDGSATKKGKKPTHAYAATGEYNVELTVTDEDGESATDTASVTIGTGNLPPVADAGGAYVGVAGASIRFDGSASTDPDGTIASYAWAFGDGGSAKGKMPGYAIDEPGTYTVTLTVTDNDGVPSSDNAIAVVEDPVAIREVLALSDANGNDSPDVALIRRDADFIYRAHVFDGGTGAAIRSIDLGASPVKAAAVVQRAGGPYDIAVMRLIPNGATRVRVVNSGSGDTVAASLQFGTDFPGIDLAAADIDGDGSPEVGVLGENPTNGQVRALFRNVDTGTAVSQLLQPAQFQPLQLLTVPTVNGGSDAEAAASVVDLRTGKQGVRVLDTASGDVLTNLQFGQTFKTVTTAVIPRAGGPLVAGIAHLGVASDPDAIRVHMRDAATGELLTTSFIRNSRSAVDLEAVSDLGGDGQADIATLIGSDNNTGRVVLFDSATGANLGQVDMQPINAPADLAVSADIDGNGADELVGLGIRNGVDRIVIFDSATGTQVQRIDVP